METAPSTCVGVSLVAFLISWVLAAAGELAAAGAIVGMRAFVWMAPYAYMKHVFRDQPGWRMVLLGFHLATTCWFRGLAIGIYPLLKLLQGASRGLWGSPISTFAWGLSLVVAIGLFPLGLYFYRAAQDQIETLQRRKAAAMILGWMRGRGRKL
jgi:hypothetical protein